MKYKTIYFFQQFACFAAPVLFVGCMILHYWILAALFFCFFVLLVWGIVDIRLALFVKTQNKLSPVEKQVALTFDDGLCDQTNAVLDILAQAQVKATFFIVGNTVEQHTLLLKRMKEQGHVIGTHTQNHSAFFPLMGLNKARKEIEIGIQSLTTALGERPVLFRPPFGITNPVIAYLIRSLQLKNTGWSLRSLDTQIPNAERLKKRILRKLKSGQIILLHDNRAVTLEILPDLIQQIKERGYNFIRIDPATNSQ